MWKISASGTHGVRLTFPLIILTFVGMKGRIKKPKHGYIYLIQVRKGNPWLHKIGITQNPPARFESLNDANAGQNIVLQYIYVARYEEKEAWLLNFCKGRGYEYKPFAGNGSTEVFRLTWLDLAIVDSAMRWWELMDDWRARTVWNLIVVFGVLYVIYRVFPWIPGLIFESL